MILSRLSLFDIDLSSTQFKFKSRLTPLNVFVAVTLAGLRFIR